MGIWLSQSFARHAATLLCALTLAPSAWAYDTKVLVTGHELPKELENIGVDEHLGAELDLDTTFTDEQGQSVPLRSFFKADKPVLMAMVYYTCPNLCNYHLNGLLDAMKQLKWTAGQDFQLVMVSMNHREGPDVAAKKKANYVKAYGRPESADGWHFLTGSEENVKKLANQLGFQFKWLEDQKQYSHASISYVVTPAGKISRYIYGIAPETQTLKMLLRQ